MTVASAFFSFALSPLHDNLSAIGRTIVCGTAFAPLDDDKDDIRVIPSEERDLRGFIHEISHDVRNDTIADEEDKENKH